MNIFFGTVMLRYSGVPLHDKTQFLCAMLTKV